MTETLPDELVDFLHSRPGHELRPGGEIDRLRLARFEEIAPIQTWVSTAETEIEDLDPYEPWGPSYAIEALDLVVKAEPYPAEGLLVWVPRFAALGSIDTEHETLLIFPGLSWSGFLADPRRYLDATWDPRPGVAESPLLWLSCPCHLEDLDLTVEPPPEGCPLHERPLEAVERRLPSGLTEEGIELALQSHGGDYFAVREMLFPCPALPTSRETWSGCPRCTKAELRWLAASLQADEPVRVAPYLEEWVKCPSCGIRFKSTDRNSFRGGRHLRCGTRLRILG